jgi:signal transduction histidine kinase
MKDEADVLASSWLARIEREARRIAGHRFMLELAIALGAAALSTVGLASQHRLDATTVAFCAALCAPLLLLRRDPRLCFAVVAVVAFAQWLLSAPQLADVAVLISLYRVALDSDLAELALAAAIVELGAIMAAFRWSPSEPLKIWVGLTGLATAAGVLGITIRQRRALLISLHDRAARLEIERDQEGRLGAAAERARIAREMHDIVAHNLSVMIALADGATYAMESSPGRASEATQRVSATGRQALLEMRRLLGVLREGETGAQPLAPQPSLDRLDGLLAQVNAAGIPVTMDLDGDPRQLPDGVQLTVFRIAQEALTNTLKHAVRPASAHLALRCWQGAVELDVTDTGKRTRAAASPRLLSGGRGLHGMRERASAYGGRLDAGPAADGGWRVSLRLRPDAEIDAR